MSSYSANVDDELRLAGFSARACRGEVRSADSRRNRQDEASQGGFFIALRVLATTIENGVLHQVRDDLGEADRALLGVRETGDLAPLHDVLAILAPWSDPCLRDDRAT